MVRTALLLTFVLLATGCARSIALKEAAASNKQDSNKSIDIERKLESIIALDDNSMSRESVGTAFDHDLDLQLDGETGFKSVSYFISKSADAGYRVFFAPDYVQGEFEAGFIWWPPDLSRREAEPPRNICVSVGKLLQSADSKGWKNLEVGQDYTTRPAHFLSKKSDLIRGPVDRLKLVSSKSTDCLVSLSRVRMSLRLPL